MSNIPQLSATLIANHINNISHPSIDNSSASTHTFSIVDKQQNSTFPLTNNSILLLNNYINNSNSNISTNNNSDNKGIAANHTIDDLFELPKMDSFVDIFSICCSIAVIFGGLVPYIPQYSKIKRSMNSDGFSTYVCLTLLLANILRIMFWFGHRFELPLLIQSFVMIIGMLAMMEICIRVRDKRTTFTISAIGFGGSSSNRRRRFLIGKLLRFRRDVNDDKNLGEYQPIYSVLADSSSSSSATNPSDSCSYHRSQPPDATLMTSSRGISSVETKTASLDNDSINNSDSDLNHTHQQRQLYSETSSLSVQPRSINDDTSHQFINHKCHWNARDFWDWDDFLSYIKFLALFTFMISLLTYLLLDNYLYIEILGYVAVFTESMLGMPQLLRNHSKKSTQGMSVEMVIMWLSGDLFKTSYFIIRHAPAQFCICGSIQVVVDILILYQVLWYRRPNVTYRKLPESN